MKAARDNLEVTRATRPSALPAQPAPADPAPAHSVIAPVEPQFNLLESVGTSCNQFADKVPPLSPSSAVIRSKPRQSAPIRAKIIEPTAAAFPFP